MEKLGVEPLQLLTQIFNFSVMVLVLSKLLYKPILKGLNERKKKIEEGLKYSEKMKEELLESDKKREEVIKLAKEEAKKIIEEGKKAGRLVEAEIIEKAHKEAEDVKAKAREELVFERAELEKQLRSQTVDIATSIVEAVLGDVLDDKSQKAVINKKIQELVKIVN